MVSVEINRISHLCAVLQFRAEEIIFEYMSNNFNAIKHNIKDTKFLGFLFILILVFVSNPLLSSEIDFLTKPLEMRVDYFLLFLVVISLDLCESSHRWTGRRLLGEEPYIPYHHICVKSCIDSSKYEMRTKWKCCRNGWRKCCSLL